MTIYKCLRGLASLPGILLLNGCGQSPRAGQTDSAKAPVAVQSVKVQMYDIPSLYTANGTVYARMESQLASQIMARTLAVNVHAGDRVHTGQVLLSLDAQETDANYQEAEAGRAEARNAVAESESNIAAAKASLDLAKVTAQRMNDLYGKRSISKQEFDEADAKLKTSQASYDMARARREQISDRIAQKEAALRQARVTRGYAVIRAPFAGVITARNIEPGALAVPGNPLLTIEAASGFRLHAIVEESRISLIHLNDRAAVFLDGLQQEIEGRVGELPPVADANSHSFTVKIDLPSITTVHSGQFGHASFSAGSRQAMTLPLQAIVENGQLQSVYVIDRGVARNRLVTFGDKRVGQVEVLSGLQTGDRVICPIPIGLAAGNKVEERQ